MKKRVYLGIVLLLFFVFACQAFSTPTEMVATVSPTKAADVENTLAPTIEPPLKQQGGQSLQPLLTIDDLDHTSLEEDIIQEIAVFGGAGGGSPHCAGVRKKTPSIWGAPEQATELMQMVSFEVCNLKPEEELKIRVEKPNGDIVEVTETAYSFTDGPTLVEFEYLPMPDDPLGQYTFDISSNDWSLDYQHEVQAPAAARLYEYDSQLFFLGFEPGEPVKLLVYQSVDERGNYQSLFRLFGWTEYQMNENGQFTVKLEQDSRGEVTYVAFSQNSGAANVTSPFGSMILDDYSVFCAGAPSPVGIRPGGRAEVLVDSIPVYTIKFSPDNSTYTFKEAVGAPLRKGSVVSITTNAQCVDGNYTWGIGCENSYCGYYLPEAGPAGPYLRSIGPDSLSQPGDPGNIPACPGTLPTRLQVGMNAEVTTSGAAPQLSLRTDPRISADQAHVIAAGRNLVILDGPICADNSYWWFIRSEQGFEGWSREGDHEDYWIDPLP